MGDLAFFVLFLLVGADMKVAQFEDVATCQSVLEQVSQRPELTAIGECTLIRLRTVTKSETTTTPK